MYREGDNYKSDSISKHCIIRTYSAGVFCGKVKSVSATGKQCIVVLDDCIRIHYWDGAASLSQLATQGVTNPNNCRFRNEKKEFDCIPKKKNKGVFTIP